MKKANNIKKADYFFPLAGTIAVVTLFILAEQSRNINDTIKLSKDPRFLGNMWLLAKTNLEYHFNEMQAIPDVMGINRNILPPALKYEYDDLANKIGSQSFSPTGSIVPVPYYGDYQTLDGRTISGAVITDGWKPYKTVPPKPTASPRPGP